MQQQNQINHINSKLDGVGQSRIEKELQQFRRQHEGLVKSQSVSLSDFRSYCKKLQAQIEQNFDNFSKKYNDHNETFMKQVNQAIQKRKQETADLKKECQNFQSQITESMDIVQRVKQSQDSFRAENNKKLTTCFREMERIQTQVLSKVNHDDMQGLSKKMAEKTYVN